MVPREPELGSITIRLRRNRTGVVLRYAGRMVRKLKTAVRYVLMAYVAYGIIYQFPC